MICSLIDPCANQLPNWSLWIYSIGIIIFEAWRVILPEETCLRFLDVTALGLSLACSWLVENAAESYAMAMAVATAPPSDLVRNPIPNHRFGCLYTLQKFSRNLAPEKLPYPDPDPILWKGMSEKNTIGSEGMLNFGGGNNWKLWDFNYQLQLVKAWFWQTNSIGLQYSDNLCGCCFLLEKL